MEERSLILWTDTFGIESSNLAWEDKAKAMLAETIHHNRWLMRDDESMFERIKEKINEIYLRNIRLFEGITDFEEIFRDIEVYNSDIITKIAKLQYDNEGYPEDPSLDPEDAIYEIEEEWQQCNSFDMWDRLEDFVRDVLGMLSASFYMPDSYISLQILGDDDLSVIFNDAQAHIFPEFCDDDFFAYYYAEPSKLRIIGRT